MLMGFVIIAPGRNYNPEDGRGSKNPVSREVAMQELLAVVRFPYKTVH